MFTQQIVIDVQGKTAEELAAAIQAAGNSLASKSFEEAEDSGDANFAISRGPVQTDRGYDANTLYVIGTNAKGEPVIRSFRTSFDAAKDYHIMSSALELSQAVELRGVNFKEHQIGSLMVRPIQKAKPPREVVQVYELAHITDLVKLDDEDIAGFAADLPGLVATLKLAKDECIKRGAALIEQMPMLEYVADSSGTVTLRNGDQSLTVSGEAVVAGYEREKSGGAIGCTGICNVVRDDDAPRHGCCQTCQKVVDLG
jgi:hypothetical protein